MIIVIITKHDKTIMKPSQIFGDTCSLKNIPLTIYKQYVDGKINDTILPITGNALTGILVPDKILIGSSQIVNK